jgi:hypothetical protein
MLLWFLGFGGFVTCEGLFGFLLGAHYAHRPYGISSMHSQKSKLQGCFQVSRLDFIVFVVNGIIEIAIKL